MQDFCKWISSIEADIGSVGNQSAVKITRPV